MDINVTNPKSLLLRFLIQLYSFHTETYKKLPLVQFWHRIKKHNNDLKSYCNILPFSRYVFGWAWFFFFFFFFWAAPVANGGSQALGKIRAISSGPHHTSWQWQILNPLSEARDWTCVLIDTGQVHLNAKPQRELWAWIFLGTSSNKARFNMVNTTTDIQILRIQKHQL